MHWRGTPGCARSRKSNPPLFPGPAQPCRYWRHKPLGGKKEMKQPGSRAKPAPGGSVESTKLASNRTPSWRLSGNICHGLAIYGNGCALVLPIFTDEDSFFRYKMRFQ